MYFIGDEPYVDGRLIALTQVWASIITFLLKYFCLGGEIFYESNCFKMVHLLYICLPDK